MAYICYRAVQSGCTYCEHCRYDEERGEKVCFGGKEAPPEENYYNYLESLRQLGDTNMYGAVPFLMSEFRLTEKKAADVLADWMHRYQELAEHYHWEDAKEEDK